MIYTFLACLQDIDNAYDLQEYFPISAFSFFNDCLSYC